MVPAGGAPTHGPFYPYVPQSGPHFVPLNANRLPRGVWLVLAVVFLAMFVLAFLWAVL